MAVTGPGGQRWERNSDFWIRIIREQLDPFRNQLTDAAVVDAVGPCRGRAVLDAGCGEGYLSRVLARRGATVTGVDRSDGLIRAAAAAGRDAGDSGPGFVRADLAGLPFRSGSFDAVVANHTLNDLRYPKPAVAELSRVLRASGRLVILMLHPCFYSGRSGPVEREEFPVDRYFSVRRVEQRFNVSGVVSPAATVVWLRPLEAWFAMLTDAGFCVSSLREPHPARTLLTGDDWWRTSFRRPLFLLVVASKA